MQSNRTRVQQWIQTFQQFSATPSEGVTRLTYSNEHVQARNEIIQIMKEAHLDIEEDGFGNIYGKLVGTDSSLPSILVGSHFDSVPNGGAFDGTAGVIAALEVATLFAEYDFQPKQTIEFVALVEEEGARFPGGLIGSRSMLGELPVEQFEQLVGFDGLTTVEAIEQSKLPLPARHPRNIETIDRYIELHIEQGPLLENSEVDIGIVESIVGLRQLAVTVIGEAGHAGTTPMDLRADALVAASKIIANLPTLIHDQTEAGTVITVGHLEVYPNGANVIPHTVEFMIDLRSSTNESLHIATERLYDYLKLHETEEIQVKLTEKLQVEPIKMDKIMNDYLKQSCKERKYTFMDMYSGAGHDAMIFAKHVPSTILFVPSHKGISHSPKEWTEIEDLCKGIDILFDLVIQESKCQIKQ